MTCCERDENSNVPALDFTSVSRGRWTPGTKHQARDGIHRLRDGEKTAKASSWCEIGTVIRCAVVRACTDHAYM
jgi:hypothetical protein